MIWEFGKHMSLEHFMAEVQRIFATGQATEHSYRAALGELFDSVDRGNVVSLNEPTQGRSGRPDFVFLRNLIGGEQVTVGHCEAKDIGLDITKRGLKDANKNQLERYRKGLPNLIYTNCTDWAFYKNGELIREIKIADFVMGIQPLPENYEALWNQLKDFAAEQLQTITSAQKLAEMMAGKAAITKDVLFNALQQDENLESELAGQYQAFKDQLIHDLEIDEFSDIYAETVAYGMFAARLHDQNLPTFSREEALNLLPKSNPFLRNLFSFVAGPNLEESIRRTIDELAEIFRHTDLAKLFENFGSFTQRNDPFIHFYETFLAEYNPKKRKARGVWYTPEPVVNFIVRAVDDVLKDEFGLKDGLADTSKVSVDWDTGFEKNGKPVIEKRQVHRVQILDPAAGTGTFLAEVIKQIAPRIKQVGGSVWNRYVENEPIPRLHGFELLMASYAMCHMKLDMMLSEMDYKPTKDAPRLNVYLTNSLEEGEREPKDLFMARWLSDEAQKANEVKNNTPIMCVIGNPPYSVSSLNKSPWILNLLEDYKKGLNEKKINIDDDYIKFIRLAQYFVEKNGSGVVGFVTNHSYIDGITHRALRSSILSCFDKIYVLDLHGSSKKKEVTPDGDADYNIFDITVGVAIVVLVKLGDQASEPIVRSRHEFGTRNAKNRSLWDGKLNDGKFEKLTLRAPYYFFCEKSFHGIEEYENGFSVNQFFSISGSGIKNERDKICIQHTRAEIESIVTDFRTLPEESIRASYSLQKDSRDWTIAGATADVSNSDGEFTEVLYRPFDSRHTYYSGKSRGFSGTPGGKRMAQMTHRNLALLSCRQQSTFRFQHVLVTDKLSDICSLSSQTKETGYVFPLYLYPDTSAEQSDALAPTERTVNMDPEIRRRIEVAAMGVASPLRGGGRSEADPGGGNGNKREAVVPAGTPSPPPETGGPVSTSPQGGGDAIPEPSRDADGRPNEVAIFDYIYGVLHCPEYRETYTEFLKIDFPRIPYPPSPDVFWDVCAKGTSLRKLHLMEEDAIGETPYPFEGEVVDGEDNIVVKPQFADGNVNINKGQYFANVPETAWSFFIGGYQPAQKWLKDRKGRELSFDDIRHYQKIIKILTETDRIMKTITFPLPK